MVEEYINEYIFSGSLPGNASTYVTREADNELFDALQKGKFCYVLNSESFRFWVASGESDESRLLRGKALQEAEEWAKDKKNLSYQDRQFLAASKEKEIQEEIAAKEQEAALERERKDREAAQQRNQLLSEANKKAQQRIKVGFVVLVVTVLGAATVGIWSNHQIKAADEQVKEAKSRLEQAKQKTKEAQKSEQDANKSAFKALKEASDSIRKNKETKQEVNAVQQLNKLAVELKSHNVYDSEEISFYYYNEALRLSALSFNINNHSLKQALVFVAKSQAYQQLKKLKEAEQEIKKSENVFLAVDKKTLNSSHGLQTQVLLQKNKGILLAKKKETQKAIESYTTAFNIFKNHPDQTIFTKYNQLVTAEDINLIEGELFDLLSKNSTKEELRKQVQESREKHLYGPLKNSLNSKNWGEADYQTYQLMLYLAKRTIQKYLTPDSINSLSCPDLQRINQLWVDSDKRFGFSVKKKIWIKTGMRIGIDRKDFNKKDADNYRRFLRAVGYIIYQDKGTTTDYDLMMKKIKDNPSLRGSLPTFGIMGGVQFGSHFRNGYEPTTTDSYFVLRLVKCNI